MPRIRFHLASPLAFPSNHTLSPLMFDSLLGYAWALEQGLYKTPAEITEKNLVFPELPLEKLTDRCYAASAMFIPEEATFAPDVVVRSTNWDKSMVQQGQGKMPYVINTGWTKGAQETLWLCATPYVDFYFRGQLEKVKKYVDIIKSIGFLGSKRSIGFGRIKSITVRPESEDWAVWRNGYPTRPLPVKEFQAQITVTDLTIGPSTYYPPYWFVRNAELCYLPPVEQYMPQDSFLIQKVGQRFNEMKKQYDEQQARREAKKKPTNVSK